MTGEGADNRLWSLLADLKQSKFIDLTHTFEPGIPHAPDMPDERSRTLYDFEKDGFRAHLYEFAGQWGTHLDPPNHFIENGRAADAIDVREMILPLVVIDIRQHADADPDYAAHIGDVQAWEEKNGRIPNGSFVALRSGWSDRWPDSEAMQNNDDAGVSHFPGWSTELLRFLVEERQIVACGHETTDTDPGILISKDEFPAETYILGEGRYQIELLASLRDVPESGAIVVCTVAKPKGGSGFPARVFAITL
jgi:kynurenine formamidase